MTRKETSTPLLRVTDLACGYGACAVLEGLDFAVAGGEMVAVLGRNGSGKSTLLRSIGGAMPALTGEILLDGLPIAQRTRRETARLMAVVPQELQVPFPLTVREVVDLGRAPHARFLQPQTSGDVAAVVRALSAANLTQLAARTFQQVSGGEQQRTVLAMALAQEPQVLLMDEPTVHLDVAHQLGLLAAVRRLCAEQGLAVLAAMHDINLAALHFDRLLLLAGGKLVAAGTPAAVLTPALIDRAFGVAVVVAPHPTLGIPQISLLPEL